MVCLSFTIRTLSNQVKVKYACALGTTLLVIAFALFWLCSPLGPIGGGGGGYFAGRARTLG